VTDEYVSHAPWAVVERLVRERVNRALVERH
jgi:hypothetical protein